MFWEIIKGGWQFLSNFFLSIMHSAHWNSAQRLKHTLYLFSYQCLCALCRLLKIKINFCFISSSNNHFALLEKFGCEGLPVSTVNIAMNSCRCQNKWPDERHRWFGVLRALSALCILHTDLTSYLEIEMLTFNTLKVLRIKLLWKKESWAWISM